MVALVVKNPLANAGEVRDTGSIPVGVKRLRGERLKPNTVGPAAECIPGDDVGSSRAPQAAAGLSDKASHSMTEDLSVGSFLNKGAATHPHKCFHQRKVVLASSCSITLKPKLRRAVGAGPRVLKQG